MFECVCCYVICFGIVCVIFSQLLWFFSVLFRLIFKWCLSGSDSCSISSASCFRDYFPFFSVHIRIYYKYPVEAKKRENLPFFFLLACLFWANLLELCVCVSSFPISISTFARRLSVFYHSSFFSVKIRKQDGFVSVWFRLFAYILCFFMSVWVMYQKVVKRKIKIQFVVTLSSIWNRN